MDGARLPCTIGSSVRFLRKCSRLNGECPSDCEFVMVGERGVDVDAISGWVQAVDVLSRGFM